MENLIRTLTLTSAWRLYLLLVGLLAALLAPGLSPAVLAADTGTVAGIVVVESGSGPKPVANAEVRLTFGSKSDSRKTGADGKYSFAGLLPGKYVVKVTPPDGLKTKGDGTISVTLDAGDTERADFGLIAPATPTPAAAPKTPSPAATPKPGTAQGSAAAAAAAAAVQGAPASLLVPGATPSAVASGTPSSGTQARANGSVLAPGVANPNLSASPAPFLFGTPSLVVAAASPTPDLLAVGTRTPTAGDETLAAGPPRRLITSFEALRQTAGGTSTSQLKSWATDTSLVLGVPFRTQIDGTSFSLVNCGPASLTMVLMAFGMDVDPPSVRDYLNHLVGNFDTEQGTSLYVLARIAREAGLTTFGTSAGLQGWTVEAVREQVRAGHPVITLTKYRFLPGHFGSVTDFDHYIVITGLAGEDFVYNDAAYSTEYGYNLLISPSQLERAWAASSVPRHAVAVGFGDSLKPLPIVPRRLTAESLAATAPVDDVQAAAPAAPVRVNRGAAAEWLREQMLDKLGARTAIGLDIPPAELTAPRTRLTPADLPPAAQAIEEHPSGAPVADAAIADRDADAVADARGSAQDADRAALAPSAAQDGASAEPQGARLALWLSPVGLGLMGFGVMLAAVGRGTTRRPGWARVPAVIRRRLRRR
ncbi:MAG: C39 family peptidase [Chloroflexi bacterium]|nr:C39 family peptidase [Chloroflexota bacterium]